ncbi:hypothetical protein B0H10DRAFT_2066904 [Mycena sp. CBHHK59/15]|nr:hypothetical protein B0H10DRAFT_2066904 [Mycena sp. CBHHK59/15]
MAPGANYMGGKRNAARARSKDITGRAHKNFFGRQRLHILSKALGGISRATSGGNSSGYGPRVSASDIGLAHAHSALAPEYHTDIYPPAFEKSGPPHTSQSTSRTKSSVRPNEGPSSGNRNSKIIEALDMKER